MKKLPDTVTIDIEKPSDIYALQKALIAKETKSDTRTVAEELAANMIDYQEFGKIRANCKRVDCFISKSSVNEDKELSLRVGILSANNKRLFGQPIKIDKDESAMGGFGLRMIVSLGWKIKLNDSKNYFIISAEKE